MNFNFFFCAKSESFSCQTNVSFLILWGMHEQAVGVCSRTILSFKNSNWTLIERLQSKQTNPVYSAPLPVGSWSSWWRWPRRRWSSWRRPLRSLGMESCWENCTQATGATTHNLFWQCLRFLFLPIFIVDWKPLPTMHIAMHCIQKKVWWTSAEHLKFLAPQVL